MGIWRSPMPAGSTRTPRGRAGPLTESRIGNGVALHSIEGSLSLLIDDLLLKEERDKWEELDQQVLSSMVASGKRTEGAPLFLISGGGVDQIESLWEVVALVSPYTTWRFIKASSPAASHCHVDPLQGSDCSGVCAE